MATSPPATGPALPIAGLVTGAWALLPPYSGPELNTETRVEIADHVVPGLVLIAVSIAALVMARRPERQSNFFLVAGFVVVLAGIWMTATHVPLVAQAFRDEAPAGGVAYHTLPGAAVAALGLAWVAKLWRQTPD